MPNSPEKAVIDPDAVTYSSLLRWAASILDHYGTTEPTGSYEAMECEYMADDLTSLADRLERGDTIRETDPIPASEYHDDRG